MSWPDSQLHNWVRDAQALSRALGADGASLEPELEAQLAGPPVVVLVGAFDSGKSSLLKRLCVDEGVPVPERLAIGGDPTTATVDEVRIGRWIVRDTPGLESEHGAHGGIAAKAALFADRVWLLVLPNLFTEDSENAWLLLTLEPGTLDIVLSRVDKPIMTPTATTIARWAATKTAEIRQLAARLGHVEVAVHVVAADPGGRVGNRTAARDRFNASREWDGIAKIRALLDEPCPDKLRRLAVIRRVRLVLENCGSVLDGQIRELEEGLANINHDYATIGERAERLRGWESETWSNLREELVLAARTGPASSARARILVAADRCLDACRLRLQEHADTWRLDFTAAPWDLSAVAAVPSLDPDQFGAAALDLDLDSAEGTLRERLDGLRGDPARIKKLESDLKDHEKAKRAHQTRDYYRREDTEFDGVRDVRMARDEVRRQRRRQTGVAVGRAMLDSLKEERKLAAQAQDRAEAERVARELAEALAVAIARVLFQGEEKDGGCRSMFDSLQEQLIERREQIAELRKRSEAEHARLKVLEARLAALGQDPK